MIDLALYREALLAHETKCNHCSIADGVWRLTGRRLQVARANACAESMVPIPTLVPRPETKA